MQIHFRDAGDQGRWAWTKGLRSYRQREVAVQLSWPEDDPRDQLIIQFFRFLESYVSSQKTRILPDQTLAYGWTMLRFVSDKKRISGAGWRVLLVEEKQNPFVRTNTTFVPGMARTLELVQLYQGTMQRNQVTGTSIHPFPTQIALTCSRVTPETIQQFRPLLAHRAWKPDERNSGWFLGCCDKSHDHDDPEQLTVIHLSHLIESFPAFFPYIAMPVGYNLLFEEERAIILHPEEEEGQIDPEPLLTSLPFSS